MMAHFRAVAGQQDVNWLRWNNRTPSNQDGNRRVMHDVASHAADRRLRKWPSASGTDDYEVRTAFVSGNEQALASFARADNRLYFLPKRCG
jgi:hypothetical protein